MSTSVSRRLSSAKSTITPSGIIVLEYQVAEVAPPPGVTLCYCHPQRPAPSRGRLNLNELRSNSVDIEPNTQVCTFAGFGSLDQFSPGKFKGPVTLPVNYGLYLHLTYSELAVTVRDASKVEPGLHAWLLEHPISACAGLAIVDGELKIPRSVNVKGKLQLEWVAINHVVRRPHRLGCFSRRLN
jgi:hypothetical protein